ncbi:MAG TPA: TetR/AcrR family transcriptional regulator [Gemmatimonadaceae bacterium]|nr:TetR/AcrR family transcriptional regulator [Gemmatimonadaceae bacterium]
MSASTHRRIPKERPKQIVDAALAVFGEHGLAAARLDDIAKRAGLSKGTIYLYFSNKEELFQEVVRQTIARLFERGEHDLSTTQRSATETLRRFIREYWSFIRSPEFAPLFRLIHGELYNFPDLVRFYVAEVITPARRLLTGMIRRGIESGEFRSVDPEVAARMLTAPLVLHAVWCQHRDLFPWLAKKSDATVLNELLRFYLPAIQMRPTPTHRRRSAVPGA